MSIGRVEMIWFDHCYPYKKDVKDMQTVIYRNINESGGDDNNGCEIKTNVCIKN